MFPICGVSKGHIWVETELNVPGVGYDGSSSSKSVGRKTLQGGFYGGDKNVYHTIIKTEIF